MSAIVVQFAAAVDVPLVAPVDVPTIRIRRTDTQALVITDSPMTEVGEGNYVFDFVPTAGVEYAIRADGDPNATGQTAAGGRYAFGSLSPDIDTIAATVAAILADVLVLRGLRDRYVLDGGSGAVSPTQPDLDAAGLILAGRVRVFATAAAAAAATLGAADGVDSELAAINITAANNGTFGHIANMRQVGP